MAKKQSVPVFILAGGLGTRISEETQYKPKPMIEIGDVPILVHLMRWYYSFGFDDFVICAGYRSWEVKNYFLSYEFRPNHLVIDHRTNVNTPPKAIGESKEQERWRVRVIDTGVDCMTGGRIARALDVITQDGTEKFENFAVTYGDGLSDVNLDEELAFHEKHGKIGTILGVHPLARFGELDVKVDGIVESFLEKPQSRQGLINGGFFFFKREFRKYLENDPTLILEKKPITKLAEDNQLVMHKHTGFWQPMDTLRDKTQLEDLWKSGDAPWKRKN